MSAVRPSATILLLRQAQPKPQIFMVKRHARIAFGTAHAFPGGVLDGSDHAAHVHCAGLSAEEADSCLSVSGVGLDYYVAAIRELFEETGVLLARDREGEWASDRLSNEQSLSALRERLNSGEVTWLDILERYDLRLECTALHYFAHWITPSTEPKRFTTHFFAAEIPHSQEANHDGMELDEGAWISASEVLAARDAGEMNLVFPTYVTLKAIRDCTSVDQVIEWTRQQVAGGISAVKPLIVDIEGTKQVMSPGEELYPLDFDN